MTQKKKSNYSCSALEMIMEQLQPETTTPEAAEPEAITANEEGSIFPSSEEVKNYFPTHEEERDFFPIQDRQQRGSEAKSRRVQLLIKPSVYEEARRQAAQEGKSFNDFVNKILEESIKKGQ